MSIAKPQKHAKRLVDVGLWHDANGGYSVHDFLHWNPSRAEVEANKDADRRRKGFHSDSDRIPDGIPKEPSRAGAGAPARARSLDLDVSVFSSDQIGEESNFQKFWSAYPRKVGKDAAAKAFEKRKVDYVLLGAIMAALEEQKQSQQWQRDGGQYIPHPATWLNQGRWQDVVESEPQFTDAELAVASKVRSAAFARCPHEPECATRAECVRLIAQEQRQRVSA
jgi:hypothetical protein